jgi:hypothetical protein
MKKQDVTLNKIYAVKVSGKIAPVQLVREVEVRTLIGRQAFGPPRTIGGGWYGLNLITKRETRIQTAAKLRYELRRCECGRFMLAHAYVCTVCSKKAREVSQ